MQTNNSSKRTRPIPRGSVDDILTLSQPIVGLAKEIESGYVIQPHQHIRSQQIHFTREIRLFISRAMRIH